MSRRVLVLDGLWYSLCPSFSPSVLNRPYPLLKQGKPSSRSGLTPALRIAASPRHRCYSSNARKTDTRSQFEANSVHEATSDTFPPFSRSISLSNKLWEDQYDSFDLESHHDEASSPKRRNKINQLPNVPKHAAEKSNDSLETLLQTEMARKPNITSATNILRLLIQDRGVKPSARHYKALILANSDALHGSPEFVRSLLEEMEKQGIAADSGTLHAALQALAVHPDFCLRQEVLQKLRDRWLTLSPAGWHFLVAGLLREHKFEMALEQLSLMQRKDITVDDWLHSSIIYHLCDMGELDEVLRLMQVRVNQGHDMTSELWMHVLRTAIEAQHFMTSRYVWRRMVELGYLHPPTTVCSDVLKLAASVSDIEIAKAVFRHLARRALSPTLQDYQQLIVANVGVGDLPAALGVLCTMHDAGLSLDQTTTQPILAYMIQSQTDRREAWQVLKRLHNEKHNIPLASVRVIAELCEHDAQNDPTVVEDAVGFYNEIHTLCPQGADLQVYNTLIRMCRTAGKREAGIFLVKEMATLNVIPDATTFETLILMCLDAGNYKSALMYLLDLAQREATVSPKAKEEIRSLCEPSVNEYALRLQYHPLIQDEDVPALDDATKTAEVPKGPRRGQLGRQERIAYNKERRQRKRRRLAMERLAAEGKVGFEAVNSPDLVDSDVDVDEMDEYIEGGNDRSSPSSKAGE
ncbi:hypothetical protein PMG11_00137 [Penicillium brasilianum]|uniref:Pentatricopeptide repeat-containing protein-mitochondrial domain-containing protein n=1 Tax=Penicillium brasilianum TaxID=104259 RepID=A0A0F7TE54_PENBI|nr:hypothetical protein PMG11_00137 [Penicillium brasilianum]